MQLKPYARTLAVALSLAFVAGCSSSGGTQDGSMDGSRTGGADGSGMAGSGQISGSGLGNGAGQQAGQYVRDARWSLIGLENFSQPVELAVPFPMLSSGLGQNVDGIIGGQFIKEFVVELDYQARIMSLHDRGKFTYSGKGTTLPLEFDSDYHPLLKATVTPLGGKPIEQTFKLDDPFLVLATQNPIEQEGTYPLPEAQLDRFLLKIRISYPSKEEEREIVERIAIAGEPKISPVVDPADIVKAREL